MTKNVWDFWQRALANPKLIGTPELPLYNEHPEWGYYRARYENTAPWEPVQLWQGEDEGWVAMRAGQAVPTEKINTLWTWCCRNPVSEEAYEKALAGGGWDDDEPTITAARGVGDNSAGLDEADVLRDQIDSAIAGIKAYEKITTPEQEAKAQSLRARLLELSGQADKVREKLVRPHLDAQKAVNNKWQPLVKDSKAAADKVRAAIAAFDDEQRRLRRIAEAELEEKRRAAEKEAREKAEAAGRPDLVETFVEAAVPPLPAPETKVKGSYGRAASKRVEIYVKEITDIDAVFAYMKEHKDVYEFLLGMANRAHKAGHTVPGVVLGERTIVT
jgi:hypothetical protein